MIEKEKHGQALCPYDPQHNSTAVYVGKFHKANTYVCGIAEEMMSVFNWLLPVIITAV